MERVWPGEVRQKCLIASASSGLLTYRTKPFMSNDVCLKIAAELEMDNPLAVIMAADMDRAEKAGERSLWEVFLPKMAGITATLVLGTTTLAGLLPTKAQAAESDWCARLGSNQQPLPSEFHWRTTIPYKSMPCATRKLQNQG
jgi:hypothetical protein